MIRGLLRRYIPHSARAALAGIVALAATTALGNGLMGLLATRPSSNTLWSLALGALVGVPATGLFFYFQHRDGGGHQDTLEIDALNTYAREEYLRTTQATIVTSSQDMPPKEPPTTGQQPPAAP